MTRTSIVLLFLSWAALAAAKPCSPEMTSRLTKAGYGAQDAAAVCAVAEALALRGVFVQVRSATATALIESLFPTTIVLPNGGDVLLLQEGRHCRALNRHAAEIIALSVWKEDGSAISPSRRIAAEDCTGDLAVIAARVAAAENGAAIATRMRLEWQPWQLKITAIDAKAANADGGEPARWSAIRPNLLGGLPVAVHGTGGIALPLSKHGDRDLEVSAVIFFADDALTIAFGPTTELSSVKTLAEIPSIAALAEGRIDTSAGNTSMFLAHEAINDFARKVLTKAPFSMGLNVKGLDDILVEQLDVTGARDRYDVAGRMHDDDGNIFRAVVSFQGADLKLKTVSIGAEPMEPQARYDTNQFRARVAQTAGIMALGGMESRGWVKYVQDRTFPFPWAGRTLFLKGTIRRTSSDDEALLFHADFDIYTAN